MKTIERVFLRHSQARETQQQQRAQWFFYFWKASFSLWKVAIGTGLR